MPVTNSRVYQGRRSALVTQHALESAPKETLCRVAHSVISPLGPGPVQTRSAQSYTAKAPATCVRGVATNRRSPGVNCCPGHRWGRAFMPRRCTQRSAPEVVQPVLVQKLSGACPRPRHEGRLWLLQRISLIAGPRHKTRRSHTLPSGVRMASRVSLGASHRSAHKKIKPLFTNTLLRGYRE